MSRYDVFSVEPNAPLSTAEASAGVNLTVEAAAVLGAHEAKAGRHVRVVPHGDHALAAAVHEPGTGWVLDDGALRAAFVALAAEEAPEGA